jgi:hypothetical protein
MWNFLKQFDWISLKHPSAALNVLSEEKSGFPALANIFEIFFTAGQN